MSVDTKNVIFKIGFVVAALTSATIFILQHLLIWFKVARLGETYNFFSFAHPDPYIYWAAMFRDILDGHLWITDGRIAELADFPSLWSFLNPLISAPIIFLTQNLSYAFILGGFLANLATFTIFYFIAKEITKHKTFSLLFTLVFGVATLIWEFLFPTSLENLKVLIRGILPLGSPTTDVLLSRYVSLSIFPTLPFFAFAFLAILKTLKTEKTQWLILSGVFTGLLIYMVITDAIYIFAGLTIILLFSLFRKDYKTAKKIFWIFLLAAAVSSFYWKNFFAIRSLPWADEFYRRLGGDFGHSFRLSFWKNYLLYAGAAFLIWLWGKKNNKLTDAIYAAAYVLAPTLVLNMQIITGFNPQPTVWFTHQFYFGFALGWLVIIFWIYDWFRRESDFLKKIFIALSIVIIFSIISRTIYTNFYIANNQFRHHYIPKNITRSLEWLNKNTPKDSIIVSPSLVSNVLLPVHTHNRTVIPSGVSSPAGQTEILDRVFVVYKLFGVTPDYLRAVLRRSDVKIDDFALNQENSLMIWVYDTYFFDTSLDSFFHGRSTNVVPEEVIEENVARYSRYPDRLEYLLNRYKMDYFYVGPYEKRIISLIFDEAPFLEKVYDEEDVLIYKIKR